jgi:hypothetical protein
MLSSHNHKITKFLQKWYPEEFVTFKFIPYKGDISVFVFLLDKEDRLEQMWNKVSGNIAGNYQSELVDEFAVWNIYVFYLCRTNVSIGLKYKIENDRFSSRKIVLDNYAEEVSDIGIDDIIRGHITNADINYDPERDAVTKLSLTTEADPVIWDIIKDETLKPGKQSFPETEQLLSRIQQIIRDED